MCYKVTHTKKRFQLPDCRTWHHLKRDFPALITPTPHCAPITFGKKKKCLANLFGSIWHMVCFLWPALPIYIRVSHGEKYCCCKQVGVGVEVGVGSFLLRLAQCGLGEGGRWSSSCLKRALSAFAQRRLDEHTCFYETPLKTLVASLGLKTVVFLRKTSVHDQLKRQNGGRPLTWSICQVNGLTRAR